MTILENAPLIETIFEVKWGKLNHDKNGFKYEENLESADFLPGKLSDNLACKGYAYSEKINNPAVPFHPRFRYRSAENTWPCFQLGTGIFTVNQIKKNYSGEAFKESIMLGIEALNKSIREGIGALDILSVELEYQDGFEKKLDQTTRLFMEKNLEFNITPPEKLLAHEACIDDSFECNLLAIQNRVSTPKGIIKVSLRNAKISGEDAFVLQSSVQTAENDLPADVNTEYLRNWTDKAHVLLKFAFKNIIKPETYERFK